MPILSHSLISATLAYAPQVGKSYDAAALHRTFGAKVARNSKNPFTQVANGFVFLIDVDAPGPGQTVFRVPEIFRWDLDKGVDKKDIPREMRTGQRLVHVYVFARPGSRGPYRCLGLGCVRERYPRSVRLIVEPGLEPATYAWLGGYIGWEVGFSDKSVRETGPMERVDSVDVEEFLKRFKAAPRAVLKIGKWGRGQMEIAACDEEGVAFCEQYKKGEWREYRRVNPNYKGKTTEWYRLGGQSDNRAVWPAWVLPRKALHSIMRDFIQQDGLLPDRKFWTRNLVIGDWPD